MFLVFSPYHNDEVSVLLYSYLELSADSSSFVRVRLMDMSRCFKRLDWNERHCLFLYSICHLTSREVGALVGISHTHVLSNVNAGRDNLIWLLNGGD